MLPVVLRRQRGLLAAAQRMVGQAVGPLDAGQGGEKARNGCEVFRPVVAVGNDGETQADQCACGMQAAEVPENRLQIHAGRLTVPPGIRLLQVVQEEVGRAEDGIEGALGNTARGLDAGVQSFAFRSREQVGGELRLRQRLATGQGHATAGGRVEGPVPQHFSQHLRRFHVASDETEHLCGAGVGAGTATSATRPVHGHPAIRK